MVTTHGHLTYSPGFRIHEPTGKYRYRLTVSERNKIRHMYRLLRTNKGIAKTVARHVCYNAAYVTAALRVVEG